MEENQKLEKAQHSLQHECKQLKEELQTAVSEKAVLEAKQIEFENLKRMVSAKDGEIEELKKRLQDKVIVPFIIGSYVKFNEF